MKNSRWWFSQTFCMKVKRETSMGPFCSVCLKWCETDHPHRQCRFFCHLGPTPCRAPMTDFGCSPFLQSSFLKQNVLLPLSPCVKFDWANIDQFEVISVENSKLNRTLATCFLAFLHSYLFLRLIICGVILSFITSTWIFSIKIVIIFEQERKFWSYFSQVFNILYYF